MALAKQVLEAAVRRVVMVVVRAEKGNSGGDFSSVQPEVILPAAAAAVNGLLPDRPPVGQEDIRLSGSSHRNGDMWAYKLLITCRDAAHALALEQAIMAQGGLLMQWGERSNVPGMLLAQGKPTDAAYFLRICSPHKLDPVMLRGVLEEMGIVAKWVAAVQIPQGDYGEALMGEREWQGGLGPEVGDHGVHPYFLGSIAEVAKKEHTLDEYHYLALVDGCHGAVNKWVEAVRMGSDFGLSVPDQARTLYPEQYAGFSGLRMRLARHIPRMPKPAQPAGGVGTGSDPAGLAGPTPSHLPRTARWAAALVGPTSPGAAVPPVVAPAVQHAPLAPPAPAVVAQPARSDPTVLLDEHAVDDGAVAATAASQAPAQPSVQNMQTIQPGQAARRDSAASRRRESGDGGGAASAPSKRQALLPGDGGMEEDQPPALGALATGAGSVTTPLAGDAAGGGDGGGQGPAVVEPAYAQPGGGAAAGEPAPQQVTNPHPPHVATQ